MEKKKILVIKFWLPVNAMAFQVVKQEGLPTFKTLGSVQISQKAPFIDCYNIGLLSEDAYNYLRSKIASIFFESNANRDVIFNAFVTAISRELFDYKQPEIFQHGEVMVYTWEE